jgi:hypothetical protein
MLYTWDIPLLENKIKLRNEIVLYIILCALKYKIYVSNLYQIIRFPRLSNLIHACRLS